MRNSNDNNGIETNGKDSVKSEISQIGSMKKKINKTPVVFFIQTSLVFIVVITALVNLSINNLEESDKKLWIILLSSCVGYILPNPSIKLPSTFSLYNG